MDLQDFLFRLLNSGQAPHPGVGGGMPGTVGQAAPAMAAPLSTQAYQAPQPVSPQPMPQSAPATGSGGGIGDFLSNVFAPKQSGKNETIQWLTQQGYDPGTAKVIASDRGALRQVILGRGQGQKPIEIAGKLVDPNTYKVLADFSQPQGRHTTTINGKLVDTDTGQVVADYSKSNGGYQLLTPDEIKAAGLPEGVYQKDSEGKITTVGGVREQDPTFGREKDLRQEYEQNPIVKNYQIVRDNYERIRQGAQLGTGSGDLAIVFGYMKMLDPTSVVREGEQASAMNAGGVPANVRNLYNRVINGDKLDQSVRDQFVTSAAGIYQEQANNLSDFNGRYTGIAQNWQLDPGRIVQMPEKYDPLQPPPAQTAAPVQPQGAPALPRIGEVRDGFVYKGGDPSQQSSWVPFPKSAPPQKSDRAAPDVMRQRFGY